VPGLNRHWRNASTAASSSSLLPVLFSILADVTQPVSRSISMRTMPRPVGWRPRSSVGYLGRTVRIATAFATPFAFREASGMGEGDCAATVEMASRQVLANSRRFIGPNE
jgi:hypothetical protein